MGNSEMQRQQAINEERRQAAILAGLKKSLSYTKPGGFGRETLQQRIREMEAARS